MRFYPSKIFLFGEYAIIDGSESLAIPFHGYHANWDYSAEPVSSRESLVNYLHFFQQQAQEVIDVSLWETQMKEGLYLHSTIPVGYGAGSSGSLVAAVYDRFSFVKSTDLSELTKIFQWMESFFHGTSSGIDPLVSYLDQAIVIRGQKIKVIEKFDRNLLQHLSIYDSGISRSTTPFVKWYKEQLITNSEFMTVVITKLIPLNKRIIEALLNDNVLEFHTLFHKIAELEQKFFTHMFPPEIVDKLSEFGLLNCKLCGAGGGGFYLVLDKKRAHKNLQALQ